MERTASQPQQAEPTKTADSDEIARLKGECSAMTKLLKKLEAQENEFRLQNEILAREALLNGFELGLLEPRTTKRRKATKKTSKEKATEKSPS